MARLITACLVWITLLGAAYAEAATTPPAMIVPGQFSVNNTGAATYTIPIAVPPGTAGMVPTLSLSYSSQNTNGIEGIGWTLNGMPSINRCPRTLAQDGVHGSVNYNSDDRFCMDGQRLVLINGASHSYGDDGSEYRTEIESFSKIIAHGNSGVGTRTGPAWFEVWTKAGQHMIFGNTADSQILVVPVVSGTPPAGTVREWAVNKISDTAGNYLSITYNCADLSGCNDRTLYGEAYPLKIDYTGHSTAPTVTPFNSVQFIYDHSRVDTIPTYQAGGTTQTTVLLTDVQTYQGASLVYDYHLGYRAGSSTTHSRLTDVTLCDTASSCATPSSCGGHCLKQTTFGWQGGTGSLALNAVSGSLTDGVTLPIPADWNGDGLTDIALVARLNVCPPYPVYLGTLGSGFVYTPAYTLTNGAATALTCSVSPSAQTVLAPNGTSTASISIFATRTSAPNAEFLSILGGTGNFNDLMAPSVPGSSISLSPYAGDYNGDGLDDFLLQGSPTSYIFIGNSLGGFTADGGHSGLNPLNTGVAGADFDGDGCTDIYAHANVSGGTTSLIYSYSCHPAVATATLPSTSGFNVTFGDFNGDGKTDILLTSPSSMGQLWLSTGTGFIEISSTIPSGWGSYQIFVGDWDGDGKADVLLVKSGASDEYYLSTGTGFTQAVDVNNNPIVFSNSGGQISGVVADWNSDGASDFLLQYISPTGGNIFYNFSYVPELMNSISNGIGSTANITYDGLNKNGTLYTKGTGATYPTQDMDGPIYVVSEVDASNGLGTCTPPSTTNCYTSKYSYAGAKSDVQGRGFLGFSSVTITDTQTNIIQTTNYVTDCYLISGVCHAFPYTGLIQSQIKTHVGNANALNSITNTYAESGNCGSGIAPAAGVHFVCLTQSINTGYDLNDTAAFPTTTTNYTYDPYGGALTVDVATYDPLSAVTSHKNSTNTYSNDTTNWFLGRLLTTSVNSIVGSSNQTRQSSFAYDVTTGLLTQESIEPGISVCNSGSSSCTLTTSYTYDAFGHRITTTISGTGITTRTSYDFYDGLGQFKTSDANALGQYEFWTYDPRFGSPATHTGPNFLTTNWSYDSFGRMTQEMRPDGTQTNQSYGYCSGGCPTYGQFYAQGEILAPGGGAQAGPVSTTYFDMLSRSIAADTQGFDGSNIRVTTVYDDNGRVQKTSRPYFTAGASPAFTQYTYDDLGRVKQATYPDASIGTYGFNGLTTTATNSLSQTTTTTKNAQGLNYQVTDATSHTTTYIYDAFADLLTVTDPAGSTTTNSYDIRGNKVASSDPDMGNWSYAYDVLSELTSQTDAKAQTTALSYDVLGRVLTRTESGLYSAWTYGTSASGHNIGQIVEAQACPTSGCATFISDKTYRYDGLSRQSRYLLHTPTDYFGYDTTYNASNGQIASVTYPSGYVVNRSYNSFGYLTQLTDTPGTLVWAINNRDAELHITSQTAGNGVVTIQAFDPLTGLIQNQRAGRGNAVASFDYSFDTIGNLLTRTDNTQSFTEHFCYDGLNRLTAYNIGSVCTGGKTAAYDTIGNITSKSDTGGYSYGGAGPHAVSAITGTVDGLTNPQYSYDATGNMTCVSSGGGCSGTIGRTISFTSFNMTLGMIQGANSLNLTYDDQHQRLQQVNTVSGTVTTATVYLNDPASGTMSERVTSAGTTPTVWNSFNWESAPWGGVTANAQPTFIDYISVDGQVVAQRSVQYPAATSWGQQTWGSFNWGLPPGTQWGTFSWGAANWSGPVINWGYFNLDHLGSVAVITGQNGAVIQRLSYDAWGKQRNANGSDASCGAITSSTTRGFTNQEQVPGGCTVNLNARLYDPSIGKFMAADPVVGDAFAPNAFNRYAYVLNNPLSFTDTSGLCFLGCFWKSPIFSAALDIGLFAVGLPELEGLNVLSAGSAGLASLGIPLLAANGALAGAVSAGVSGGSILKGAAVGGLSAGLSFGVAPQLGNAIGGTLQSAGVGVATANDIGNSLAQGAIGGITSVAGGGNFGSGFLAGGVGSLAGGFQGGSFNIGNLIASATVGGAASELGGGKFANGAVTGAFSYAAGASYANDNTASNMMFAGPGASAPAAAPGLGEAVIDGLEGLGAALGSGVNALATGLSLVLSGDTQQYVYHFTDQAGYAGISQDGTILPGKDGFVYLSPYAYNSAQAAQQMLALPRAPIGYFQMQMSEPGIPTVVQPQYGQPGGGYEIKVPNPVPVGGATFHRIGP